HQLADYLHLNDINPEKGIAVVQQATTPFQKTSVFTFEELKTKELPEFEYVPTLIIVGNVVNLHQHYNWFKEQQSSNSYFDNHITTVQYAS
ncbi:MAG: hypothetical protein ABI426_10350, partial [Flavobacterium sp.]